MSEVEAWCVLFKGQSLHLYTCSRFRRNTVDVFLDENHYKSWREAVNNGYKVVKVKITEVSE